MTNGSIMLNGINDKQVAKVFEFKTSHENQFVVTFNSQPNPQYPQQQQKTKPETTYNGFTITWGDDAGLKVVLELVNLLLQ
jgi:hypothetical protein